MRSFSSGLLNISGSAAFNGYASFSCWKPATELSSLKAFKYSLAEALYYN